MRRIALSCPSTNNTIHPNVKAHEVSMKKQQHEAKPLMVARFQAEARAVLSKRSDRQSRLLKIAVSSGRDMEPVGRMAGVSL